MSEKQPPLTKAVIAVIILMTAVFTFAIVMHVESQKYEVNVQPEGVLVSDVFKENAETIGEVNKIRFTDEGISLDTGKTAKFIIKTDEIDTSYPVLIYLNTSEEHHRWNIVFYNGNTHEFRFYTYAQTPSEDEYAWWVMTLPNHGNAILTASNTDKMYVQSPSGTKILTHGNVAYRGDIPLSMKIRLGDPKLMWVEDGKVYSDNWDGKMYPATLSGEAIGNVTYHITAEEDGVKRLNYADYEYNICNYYVGESEVLVTASHMSESGESLCISLIAVVIVFAGVSIFVCLNYNPREKSGQNIDNP